MGEIFERIVPHAALRWTGEHLATPSHWQIEIGHLHRYFLARDLCRGLDVIDVASGDGYGSALLAQTARSVVGIEWPEHSVSHAAGAYELPNLEFVQGSTRKLPIGNACADAVVSFEILEQFYEHDDFIAEARRVLRPGGRLFLSLPERDAYSPPDSSANPLSIHQSTRSGLESLLRPTFPHIRFMAQRSIAGSGLIANDDIGATETVTFERRDLRHYESTRGLPRPQHIIAVASSEPLPSIPNFWFIATREDSARGDAEGGEIASSLNRQLHEAIEASQVLTRRVEYAEAALVAAHRQRDALRTSFRRKIASSHLQERVAMLEADATEWRNQYFNLRNRLEAILRRFWILRLARLAPPSFRRFVRNRVLGPKRQS